MHKLVTKAALSVGAAGLALGLTATTVHVVQPASQSVAYADGCSATSTGGNGGLSALTSLVPNMNAGGTNANGTVQPSETTTPNSADSTSTDSTSTDDNSVDSGTSPQGGLTSEQNQQLTQMIGSMSTRTTERVTDKGSAVVKDSTASKSGNSLMSAVTEVATEKNLGGAMDVTLEGAKSGVEVARIAASAASDSGAVNSMVSDVSALAVAIPRASAGDPTAALPIAQHGASLAGNGLGIAADVIRMYKASESLPQIKEVFGIVDPNSQTGKAIFASLPKEAQTPEITSAMAATTAVGNALDALDFASMADLASAVLLGISQGNMSCLASAPQQVVKSLTSIGEAVKALSGTNPGAMGTVMQATTAGVAKASAKA